MSSSFYVAVAMKMEYAILLQSEILKMSNLKGQDAIVSLDTKASLFDIGLLY